MGFSPFSLVKNVLCYRSGVNGFLKTPRLGSRAPLLSFLGFVSHLAFLFPLSSLLLFLPREERIPRCSPTGFWRPVFGPSLPFSLPVFLSSLRDEVRLKEEFSWLPAPKVICTCITRVFGTLLELRRSAGIPPHFLLSAGLFPAFSTPESHASLRALWVVAPTGSHITQRHLRRRLHHHRSGRRSPKPSVRGRYISFNVRASSGGASTSPRRTLSDATASPGYRSLSGRVRRATDRGRMRVGGGREEPPKQ